MLERALAIQDRRLADDDPEKARTPNNLGSAYRMLKRYREALPYLDRALAIRERALGPEHPHVPKQLASLGAAHLMLDDSEISRRYFDHALDIGETRLPRGHPDLAKTAGELATALSESGNDREAEEVEARDSDTRPQGFRFGARD